MKYFEMILSIVLLLQILRVDSKIILGISMLTVIYKLLDLIKLLLILTLNYLGSRIEKIIIQD